jgi:hypothetical protein
VFERGECRNCLCVEEEKCGKNLMDFKAVAGVGARMRVPDSAGVVVEEGKCRNHLCVEEGKCRKNLVDFKPIARVGARTRVPEGGVVVVQLVLMLVCLVCGWVFDLYEDKVSNTCGWCAKEEG